MHHTSMMILHNIAGSVEKGQGCKWDRQTCRGERPKQHPSAVRPWIARRSSCLLTDVSVIKIKCLVQLLYFCKQYSLDFFKISLDCLALSLKRSCYVSQPGSLLATRQTMANMMGLRADPQPCGLADTVAKITSSFSSQVCLQHHT